MRSDEGSSARPLEVFVLYIDPSEVDASLEEPGYLRGVFLTLQDAQRALGHIPDDAADARWVIVRESIDEPSWSEGFVTTSQDDE